MHHAEARPGHRADHARNRKEQARAGAVDHPPGERHDPGLKRHETGERPLHVRQLPVRGRNQRLHKKRPGVLEIRNHHHGEHGCPQPNPPTYTRVIHVQLLPAAEVTPSSFAQAYTVRVWGIAIPSFSPSSTTAPTTGSSSMGRPASRSCSMEVLCSPTFSAPAILWSMEMGSSIPSLLATASTSAMILRTTGQMWGSRAMVTRVARVRALMGLKATLPSSFTQISWR